MGYEVRLHLMEVHDTKPRDTEYRDDLIGRVWGSRVGMIDLCKPHIELSGEFSEMRKTGIPGYFYGDDGDTRQISTTIRSQS